MQRIANTVYKHTHTHLLSSAHIEMLSGMCRKKQTKKRFNIISCVCSLSELNLSANHSKDSQDREQRYAGYQESDNLTCAHCGEFNTLLLL